MVSTRLVEHTARLDCAGGSPPVHTARRCRTGLLAALVTLVVAMLGLPAVATADNPLEIVSQESIDSRLQEWTLETPALADQTKVRILLPTGYASHPLKHYPVLYLLHGTLQDYRWWTDATDVEEFTADSDMIVVMPDSGPANAYIDWYNNGAGGQPQWETYHVEQLVPLIDDELRTIPLRRARGAAGLSSGGYGAMVYAARHPDKFITAHSFSGAVDGNVLAPLIGNDTAAFGSYETNQIFWRGHNPWDLAENVSSLDLRFTTGNGQPGPIDPDPFPTPEEDPFAYVEPFIWLCNTNMHNRLNELSIDHVYYDYGPGTHTTPYFERSLEESVPLIEATFDNPPAYPTTLRHYKAIETDYDVFGWHVSLDRNVREFSSLQNANGNGFEFVGSGSAVVTTPTRYLPFSWHEVTIETGSGTDVENIQANWLGKLTIPFEVGPDNQYDQYSPAEVQNPSTFHHVDVDID